MTHSTAPFLGHEKVWQSLQTQVRSNRLPQALLFQGPEGIGKQRLAKALAGMILGSSQDHPDFLWVEPENGRIKIDTVRDLKRSMAFPPFKGDFRVVVINDAHCLNIAAANAFLKTLEEPPPSTRFILITHAMGWLPRTIVSRCQVIRFSPLTDKEILEILGEQKIKTEPAQIRRAQGSPLRFFQLQEINDLVPSLPDLFPPAPRWGFNDALHLAETIIAREKIDVFLTALLGAIHQLLTAAGDHADANFDLLVCADRILEIRRGLRQNINPKIQLTRLLLFFQEPKESRYAG